MPSGAARAAIAPVAALAVLLAVLYASTLSSTVLGGDNAEFVTLFARGGVAHPSGYPLFCAWLRVWGLVWPGDPTVGASVATATLGVGAAVWLVQAARRWGASTSGALLSGALYGFAPLVWALNTHAEVFALHALLAAAVLWLASPCSAAGVEVDTPTGAKAPRARHAFGLGVLGGFGLCNNHTLVLMAPLGLLAAWVVVRDAAAPRRALAMGGLGLLVGLLPVALMPLLARGDVGWVWGDLRGLDGLLHHVLRRDFGTFQLGIYEGGDLAARHVAHLGIGVVRELSWVGVALAVVGLAVLCAQPARRRHGVALATALLLAGPALLSRFNLAPEGVAVHVVERFWVLPLVLLSFAAAFGYDATVARIPARARRWAPALLVAFVAARAPAAMVRVGEHHDPSVELYLRDTAAQLARNTVLIGTGDHRLFGFLWLDEVVGLRPDVVYIDASMLLYPWYMQRVSAQLGAPVEGVDPVERTVSLPAVIGGLQRLGRPVAITNVVSETIPRNFALVPLGTVLEVRPPGSPTPSLPELAQANQRIASSYVLAPAPVARQSWATLVREDYARPWRELAAAFERAGAAEPAAQARAIADAWTQTYDP